MRIIYCDSVIDHKVIEPDYKNEKEAAIKVGFTFSLVSFEELVEGNISKALKSVRTSDEKELAIYRGWMLTPTQYKLLFEALLLRNIQLINSPKEYQHCHYLPNSYDKIESKTPQSNWTTEMNDESIRNLASEFDTNPIIVKDFVKSEKHNWKEACFIPDASDYDKVHSVVTKFLELRGDLLNKGLVFRKFEELEFLTDHSKSKMPLTMEFRVFFVNKKVVNVYNYWNEGDYGVTTPELEEFIEIAKTIDSNFFTMDVAKKKSGEWIIMELGDGQVAGLPENADEEGFYQRLKENLYH